MKDGDISNVSSPQVICISDVVVTLEEEEERKLLSRKTVTKIGNVDVLATNKLWNFGTKYGVALELVAFESEGWTEELLDKAFEKLERRVVNPFNYWELYEDMDELLKVIPYRPNLRGVVDLPNKVARYGSLGVELDRIY